MAGQLMGRVTFQNDQVQEIVKKSFVPVWLNANPGYGGSELRVGKEDLAPLFAKWWPNGRADTNVKTIVATKDGEVVHAIPGFVRPGTLVAELEFALDVAKAMDAAGADPVARGKARTHAHAERLAELERRWGKLDAAADPFAGEIDGDDARLDRFPRIQMGVAKLLMTESSSDADHESTADTIVGTPKAAKPRPKAIKAQAQRVGRVSALAPAASTGPPPATYKAITISPIFGAWWKPAALPAARRYAAASLRGRKVAGARVVVRRRGGSSGGSSAPTADEIAQARAGAAASDGVDRAIAAFGARSTDARAWKTAVSQVRTTGSPALLPLLEAAGSSARSEAAFGVLRAVTGELIPDDLEAWTRFLAGRQAP
jgi:hypothetical protein